MSRQYDAKQQVLAAYPERCDAAEDLFLGYLGVSRKDFEYEESQPPLDYIYGKQIQP